MLQLFITYGLNACHRGDVLCNQQPMVLFASMNVAQRLPKLLKTLPLH